MPVFPPNQPVPRENILGLSSAQAAAVRAALQVLASSPGSVQRANLSQEVRDLIAADTLNPDLLVGTWDSSGALPTIAASGSWYVISGTSGPYEDGGRLLSNGTEWTPLPPPFYQLPGSGEVTRAMLEPYIAALVTPSWVDDAADSWVDQANRRAMWLGIDGMLRAKLAPSVIEQIEAALPPGVTLSDFATANELTLTPSLTIEQDDPDQIAAESWQDPAGRTPMWLGKDGQLRAKLAAESIAHIATELDFEADVAAGLPVVEGRIARPFFGVAATAYNRDATDSTANSWAWKRMPDLQTRSMTLGNDTGRALLARRALPQPRAWFFEGNLASFAAGSNEPVATGGKWVRGQFWNLTGGGRVVFLSQTADSTTVYTQGNHAYEVVDDDAGIFQMGGWDPNTQDPTTDLSSDYREGDFWEVTVAGTWGGFEWAVGDRWHYATSGWYRVPTSLIVEIANAAQVALPCAVSLSEWEIRRADGARTAVYPKIEGYVEGSLYAIEDSTGPDHAIRIWDAWSGKYDALAAINSAGVSNTRPVFSTDGRKLYFYSKVGETETRRYIEFTPTAERPEVLRAHPVLPGRQVSMWGDSLGNAIHTELAPQLAAFDVANGQPARPYQNFSYGSMDQDQFVELMDYQFNVVENAPGYSGTRWQDGILVLSCDARFQALGNRANDGTQVPATRSHYASALIEVAGRLKASARRWLFTSMYSYRRNTIWAFDAGANKWIASSSFWGVRYEYDLTANTAEFITQIGDIYAARKEQERLWKQYFPDNHIELVEIFRESGTAVLDPQFPGMTSQQVADFIDTYPYEHTNIYRDLPADGVDRAALNFLGFTNTAPAAESGNVNDYYRVTGSGITLDGVTSSTEGIVYKTPSGWKVRNFDGVHFTGASLGIAAGVILEKFTEKGWL